jgi:hypothetical protein
MPATGLLELTHEKLQWPSRKEVMEPTGAGPGIYARLAKDKLERAIASLEDSLGVEVGVLAGNSQGDQTEAPIAIVCEFKKAISQETLRETHRLAWNFSHSPLLIAVEPRSLRAFSCCEPPLTESEVLEPVTEVTRKQIQEQTAESLELHWAGLVSGQFFQERDRRFQRRYAADNLLLSNLKSVRAQLAKINKLDYETIHDLLARIIFIQFLCDRKDSQGKPALSGALLDSLYESGELSGRYRNLPELLRNHRDTYQFFRWLNHKFNGDLFPGKGTTKAQRDIASATLRDREWQAEEKKVTQQHLNLLAEFVSGKLEMETGQRCLWRQYSFDVIPLEFISSIYEEFVRKNDANKSVHYTPGHIVDFILDGVLSWNSPDWDVKILDPACGSGIFLVKAFQRLIHRWKIAHPGEEISSEVLNNLLLHNFFGVDINSQATRVASFSLYLTMCEAMEPDRYWQDLRFPRLRDKRLIAADFFREDLKGFRTELDAKKYDLVIGNAPWGRNTATELAKAWAKDKWEITYGNIGPLFLPKAAALTKPGGRVAIMQPAGVLIFNQIGTSKKFREKLFSEFKVEEIVNLSALRFGLFKDAISPTCIVTICPSLPDGEPFYYLCPKPVGNNEDDYRIVIELQDMNLIYPQEAITNSLVFSALMWGGRRDLALVKRLSREPNLEKLENDGIAVKRQGIIRGDRQKLQPSIIDRKILESPKFPQGTFLFLKVANLPINKDSKTHSRDSTDFSAFEVPQMILKQSWQKSSGRFQAAIIKSDNSESGIICSGSYVSIHVNDERRQFLEAACLSYNSKLAVYYLLLSSGRFACYIPEVKPGDLLRVPIPEPREGLLENLKTFDDVDERVREFFEFKDSEWVLIEDLFNYTLPNFKGDRSSPGRQTTRNYKNNSSEPILTKYCEYFLRVIKAGFGSDKNICATIFQEQTKAVLPVRLVAIYLNRSDREAVKIEPIQSLELMTELEKLNKLFVRGENAENGNIFYQRTAKIYDSVRLNGETIPTIYFVKPDKIRYWTRSMALRDADEVAADLMMGAAKLST